MKKYEAAAKIREILGAHVEGLHKLTLDETHVLLKAIEDKLSTTE